uniref:hypothetical protein n=1 Tax=Paractinoplanes polyasparticus TaxID=2856853 RepID=UPI0027E01F6A|nr:hypothetical protein [Actinoplanes polyasparticus]
MTYTYAAYDRTYKGLPVKGGDFVVVTDDAGQTRYTSVAQSSPSAEGISRLTVDVDAATGAVLATQEHVTGDPARAPAGSTARSRSTPPSPAPPIRSRTRRSRT